jgi:hypothetical protein
MQNLIVRSASVESKEAQDKPLLCTQESFNKAIEVTVKLLDRLDRSDRLFAEDE